MRARKRASQMNCSGYQTNSCKSLQASHGKREMVGLDHVAIVHILMSSRLGWHLCNLHQTRVEPGVTVVYANATLCRSRPRCRPGTEEVPCKPARQPLSQAPHTVPLLLSNEAQFAPPAEHLCSGTYLVRIVHPPGPHAARRSAA